MLLVVCETSSTNMRVDVLETTLFLREILIGINMKEYEYKSLGIHELKMGHRLHVHLHGFITI